MKPSKEKCEKNIRGSVGQLMIAMSSFASRCTCIVGFVSANYRILHRIASLNLDDESDIDWKSLGDSSWNMWSSHFLRQKWRQLRASYNANDVMCHRGLYMTIVLQFPPHILDRRRTSPHNPGLCDKTNVYANEWYVHTIALSIFHLLQSLNLSLRVRVIVLRPDSLLSFVHITHPRVRIPIPGKSTSLLIWFTPFSISALLIAPLSRTRSLPNQGHDWASIICGRDNEDYIRNDFKLTCLARSEVHFVWQTLKVQPTIWCQGVSDLMCVLQILSFRIDPYIYIYSGLPFHCFISPKRIWSFFGIAPVFGCSWSVDVNAVSLRQLLVPCKLLAVSTTLCKCSTAPRRGELDGACSHPAFLGRCRQWVWRIGKCIVATLPFSVSIFGIGDGSFLTLSECVGAIGKITKEMFTFCGKKYGSLIFNTVFPAFPRPFCLC